MPVDLLPDNLFGGGPGMALLALLLLPPLRPLPPLPSLPPLPLLRCRSTNPGFFKAGRKILVYSSAAFALFALLEVRLLTMSSLTFWLFNMIFRFSGQCYKERSNVERYQWYQLKFDGVKYLQGRREWLTFSFLFGHFRARFHFLARLCNRKEQGKTGKNREAQTEVYE